MKTWIFLCRHRVYQYLAAISGTMCIMSSEMHFGWTSQALPPLTDGTYKLQISKEEGSWLAITLLIGTILGAVIAGALTDILGRKKVILISSCPLLIGWIMIGMANSAMELFVGRLIAGIANGLSFSSVPMYLAEIAETKIRGLVSSMCPVCVVLGILIINILGSIYPVNTTAYIATFFPVFFLITFIWMPESPSFLLQKNKKEEAERVLKLLRTENEAEEELQRVSKFLDDNQEGSLLELISDKTYWKAALIAYGLRTVQQFCGTTVLTFYCKTIFQESASILSANISTIIYFSLQLILSFTAIFLVDLYGRKPLLLVSTIGSTLTLFIMSAYLVLKEFTTVDTTNINYLPLVALFLNVTFFSVGVRIVPLLMMGEVFSPRFRAKAICLGCIYFSIIGIIFTKLFYEMSEIFGLAVPFIIFSVLSFCSIFFVIFIVPETKGLNLEDIQVKIKRQRRHNATIDVTNV